MCVFIQLRFDWLGPSVSSLVIWSARVVVFKQNQNSRTQSVCLSFEEAMLGTQVQIFLVAMCWSVVPVEVSGAPSRDQLMETLRSDLLNEKDVSRWFLLKFMPNLMTDAPSDEMIRELEEDEEDEEETKARGRDAVMRRHLSLAQRERKAGCRNFFWKTFTSC
ncbi:somatostatin-1A [Gouania willdenowi]|uniref:somatostatin-1A n=1 Tax=Gouania willdenowi TaxID=441366 RepID=UPI001056CB56|nr:somatostatin-1A-like [Gouania willdenowi]